MLIMGAHHMLNEGATVVGANTAAGYFDADLVNGEPHDIVRTDSGSFSVDISRMPGLSLIDALVLGYHNLDAGLVVTFSGLGTVTTLSVPENDIRLNPYTRLVSPSGLVTAVTVAASGNSEDCQLGAIYIGRFAEIHPVAGGPQFSMLGFGIPHPGEFGGRGYAKGGEARRFGGTGWVTDAEKQVLDACWRASRENSRPTIIVPYDWSDDAWDVNWESYDPRPHQDDGYEVSIVWAEVSRVSLPA